MTTLFVSDLHLDAALPEIGDQFTDFLATVGGRFEALYILGDLFESWVGDDDPQPEKQRLADALSVIRGGGTPIYFMHGNRDFLLGRDYARAAGMQLLEDEVVVELGGRRVLLMHGDSLCTDDHEYQAFRATVRDPQWQRAFLSQPLAQRLALARAARDRSRARNANAPAAIMDVNQAAVEAAMRRYGVTELLHGHTHRPAVHEFELDGAPARRVVLGDWYDQGSIVTWGEDGPALQFLPRA